MSRISKDSAFDVSSLSTLSTLPRRSIVDLTPSLGAIVYDISSNSLAISDGSAWEVVGGDLAGFPISNPPGPLPNGGIPIFNNSTNEWTVYSLTGDISLSNTGVVTVNRILGTPLGPFSSLTSGDVLSWSGTAWVNAPVSGSAVPSGPAGGDLAGTYPNPTLAAIGAAAGPIGNGTTVPVVTIDAKGRVTALTSTPIQTFPWQSASPIYLPPGGTLLTFGPIVFQDGWNAWDLQISWHDTTPGNVNGGCTSYITGGFRVIGGVVTHSSGALRYNETGQTPDQQDWTPVIPLGGVNWRVTSQHSAPRSVTFNLRYSNSNNLPAFPFF